jgi:ribosome-associated translation inhibitor RaiA
MMHAELRFNGIDQRESAEASVLRWIARIEQLDDRVTRCGVTLDRRWRQFEVTITIEDPDVGVSAHAKHQNIYIAIADAFRLLRRQVQTSLLQRAS